MMQIPKSYFVVLLAMVFIVSFVCSGLTMTVFQVVTTPVETKEIQPVRIVTMVVTATPPTGRPENVWTPTIVCRLVPVTFTG